MSTFAFSDCLRATPSQTLGALFMATLALAGDALKTQGKDEASRPSRDPSQGEPWLAPGGQPTTKSMTH